MDDYVKDAARNLANQINADAYEHARKMMGLK